MIAEATRRLADALSVSVVNAARRMHDEGLRDRVLAAEGRHVAGRWADEFGFVHCPSCGRVLTELVSKKVPVLCPSGCRP